MERKKRRVEVVFWRPSVLALWSVYIELLPCNREVVGSARVGNVKPKTLNEGSVSQYRYE
jgi:hypothetical protein